MKKLVIIGAGPGGYEVAIEASHEDLEVILIDKADLGGTCLNVGCIPTKTIYKSAEIIKNIKSGEDHGVNGSYELDFARVIEKKNEVVEGLQKGIEFLLNKGNVRFIQGEASFISEKVVKVNDEEIEADYIIIASGSYARKLNIPGADQDNVVTSTEMLDLKEVPKSLCVIGGGVIGSEFASIFNLFGSEVTILEYMPNLLGPFEEDIAKRFKPTLSKQGIKVITNAGATKIEGNTVYYESKGKEASVEADLILMSTGRGAYMDNLGLENAGIEYDKFGIKVDDKLETNVSGVWAVGDCLGKVMLAHTASYQSFYVLDQIMNRDNNTNMDMVPGCVFTFPELSMIGLTKKEAIEKYGKENVEVRKSMYTANGKANAMGETNGFLQLVMHDGYVVGGSIMGYSASTIIHEIALIIHSGRPLNHFRGMIFAHPTLSEVLMHAIRHI